VQIFLNWLIQIEPIRLWISVLFAPVLTIVGFTFLYGQLKIATKNYDNSIKQAIVQQKWKETEFIANQAKDFFSDEIVDRVICILDWEWRKFPVPSLGKELVLFLHAESSEEWAYKKMKLLENISLIKIT
jgi:hypothetical protein